MDRLTKKIAFPDGTCTYDFANGKANEFLTDHEKGVRALFERLAQYEDLEEQGRLIELPCKVGTKVWYIFGQKIYECEVVEVIVESGLIYYNVRNSDFSIIENRPATIFHSLPKLMFEAYCFFTKEEAEEKLEEYKKEFSEHIK